LRQVGKGHPRPDSQSLPLDDLKTEAWRLLKSAEGNADPIAAMGAATAFLLALHHRDRTGEGQEVLTTMIGSDLYANSDEAIDYAGRPPAPRVDEDLFGLGPLYRLYRAADGWVFLACVRRGEWDACCSALGRPDLASRWQSAWQSGHGAGELAEEIAELLRSRTADDWERLMCELDVPLVSVEMRDPGRFNMEDPVVRQQGYAVQVDSPLHGTYWRHGALQQFSDSEPTLGPWEPLGGHTRSILRELGYSESDILRLISDKTVEVWASPEY
jgi:crotonobetainyl-CoA:carnitine CoA-transferase CaiB-like acyl-CoA transferase